MSVETNYYLINGYDLAGMETDKLDDWKWSDEGEDYTNSKYAGKIQLFDDPMSGRHLYLGYILAAGDQYEFNTTKVDNEELYRSGSYVYGELTHLQELGVIESNSTPKLELIMFEESY